MPQLTPMAKICVRCFLMCILCELTLTSNELSANSLTPTHYTLLFSLKADWTRTKSFEGTTNIFFIVNEPSTSIITLHASSLHISEIQIFNHGNNISYKNMEYKWERELLVINLVQCLKVGPGYQLFIKYDGLLDNDESGLHVSSYSNGNNVTSYAVKTVFKPNFARRAFPCFDEPQFQTTFYLMLMYPNNFAARANTVLLTSSFSEDDIQTIARFQYTPKISTASLEFAISEFLVAEKQLAQYWPEGDDDERHLNFGRGIVERVIPKMEYLTGIPRERIKTMENNAALMKVDENDLVKFEDIIKLNDYYMFDGDDKSVLDEIKIASEAVDDCVRYWFKKFTSDLKSEDSWLHMALKSHFKYLILDEMYPNLQLSKQFIIKVARRLLRNDGFIPLDRMSSLEQQREKEMQYLKGVNVIHMMHRLNNTFQDAIIEYLNKTLTENAKISYTAFKDQLKQVSYQQVGFDKLMDKWITNEGYPLITIMPNGNEIDYHDLLMAQHRYHYVDPKVNNHSDWYVPLNFIRENHPIAFQDSLRPHQTKLLSEHLDNDWIILHDPAFGYYRVYYDYHNINRISKYLKENLYQISNLVRAQLVDDVFNLAISQKMSYAKAFNLLDYLAEETDYFVWFTAFENFKILLERIHRTELKRALTAKILGLMEKVYQSVPHGITKFTDPIYTLKQVMVHEWACNLNHRECIKYAVGTFRYFMNNPSRKRPPAYFRSFIYCTGLQNSYETKRESEFLWDEFHQNQSIYEQQTILMALGCTNDQAVLKDNFDSIMSLETDKKILITHFKSVTSRTIEGRKIAYEYFKDNINDIGHYFDETELTEILFRIIANSFTTQEEIDDFQIFTKSHGFPYDLKNFIGRPIKEAKENVNFYNNVIPELNKYFNL